MNVNREIIVRARRAAVCASLLLLGGWGPPQDTVTPEEMHQIQCSALQLPFVRAAVDRGAGPLLVISGREHGILRAPAQPCPADARLPRGASEIRFIRPHTAPRLYGERAANGAVLVDLPPAPAARR